MGTLLSYVSVQSAEEKCSWMPNVKHIIRRPGFFESFWFSQFIEASTIVVFRFLQCDQASLYRTTSSLLKHV